MTLWDRDQILIQIDEAAKRGAERAVIMLLAIIARVLVRIAEKA